ncbi:MAG: WG repeat-containing protein [Paludibacteraceae bacterium]|nr:WG repeat-containing protein [Paludibacteraceae bacterium]
MKKSFLYVAVLALCAAAFVSCEPNTQRTDKTKVWPAFNADMKCGYINIKGEFVVPCIYDGAALFSSGLGLVVKEGTTDFTLSFINAKGDTKITLPSNAEANPFCEDMSLGQMTKGSNWGFRDPSGKLAIAAIYEDVDDFSNGAAIFVNSDGKYGAIDKSGKVIVQPQWDRLLDFSCELARYRTGKAGDYKYGFIDKSGKIAIDASFPTWDWVGPFSENLAPFRSGTKYGFIDKKGNVAIQPLYDEVGFFSEGLAAVELNDKWGYIDTKGTMKIQTMYDDCFDFWEGLAFVVSGTTWSVIDKKGNVKFSLGDYQPVIMGFFHNGVTLIAKEDVSGKIEVRYVNTKNEPIYSVLVDGGPRAPEKIMGQPKMLNKEPKKHTYRLGKTITVK